MPSCQCEGIEVVFDDKTAKKELKQYRKKGPEGLTLKMINYLKEQGVEGKSLLDIGGGTGAIQHELMAANAAHVTSVDGSSAYLAAAKEEAELRRYTDRATYHHGNFVELAGEVEDVDIVTLDKVLCCFDDVDSLVKLSVSKAKKFYAVVYPRDTWWAGIFSYLGKILSKIKKTTFSVYIHPNDHVERMIKEAGFTRAFAANATLMHLVIYSK